MQNNYEIANCFALRNYYKVIQAKPNRKKPVICRKTKLYENKKENVPHKIPCTIYNYSARLPSVTSMIS